MKDKIFEILKAKVQQQSYHYMAHGEPHFGMKISEQSLIDATTEIVNLISVNNFVSGELPNCIDCFNNIENGDKYCKHCGYEQEKKFGNLR